MRRKILAFLCVAALLFASVPRAAANTDVHVSGSTYYVTLASGVPWNQVNGNYIFTPISPNTGMCIFIENLNPTSQHTYTLGAFETGNKSNTAFAGNSARWVTATLLNPTTSVPANSVSASFFSATGAANVAITISGATTAAGSPDTANVFVTQSNTSSCGATGGAFPMQGAQAIGTTPITNPIFSAGATTDTNKIEPIPILSGGSFDSGLELGAQFGFNSNVATWRLFGTNGTTPSAIGTGLFVNQPDLGNSRPTSGNPVPVSVGVANGANSLFTQNAGEDWTNSVTVNSVGTTTVNITTRSEEGVHQGCIFVLTITGTITGTSPTLDVFIQDSQDKSTVWDDRVHFAQLIGTSTGSFTAAVSGGSITPRAVTDGTLAASAINDGQLEPFLRAKLVATGTNPVFPIEIFSACQ